MIKARNGLKRILRKLYKKDRTGYNQVMEKMNEILTCEKIEHYKNLRKPLQHLKRVQIGSFVLTFRYDKKEDKITFYDYDHHDKIYK
ncbi:MAG: hypothetical protein GF334_09630 [Candidatus Altiarchaeales archaeon]|nr:hypothetical protein [Candidatus Altiarchaeales archaeon]